MAQKLKQKLKTKGNKGFTLVELIVVIVILAILIGVTIGGVFGYVNKSRINTDINNAAAIQSACSLLATDRTIASQDISVHIIWREEIKLDESITRENFKAYMTEHYGSGEFGFLIKDNKTGEYYDENNGYDWQYIEPVIVKLQDIIKNADGLPAPKTADYFLLELASKGDGINVTISCKAYKVTGVSFDGTQLKHIYGNPLEAQE